MTSQPWHEIPIVDFQTLPNYEMYRLERVVTHLFYRKNETQRKYFAHLTNEYSKKKIWLTEKYVNRIQNKKKDQSVFLANTYKGYEYFLEILHIKSDLFILEFEERKFELA